MQKNLLIGDLYFDLLSYLCSRFLNNAFNREYRYGKKPSDC